MMAPSYMWPSVTQDCGYRHLPNVIFVVVAIVPLVHAQSYERKVALKKVENYAVFVTGTILGLVAVDVVVAIIFCNQRLPVVQPPPHAEHKNDPMRMTLDNHA